MINSINILNENNILLEIDMSKIKKKFIGIWEALKKFITMIINKITSLFRKNTRQDIKKTVEEKFKAKEENKEDNKEEKIEVEILKPTEKFINTFESEYKPKVNELAKQIKDFSLKLNDIAKGKSTYDKEELENEAGKLCRIVSELENDVFKNYGGITYVTHSNRDCFEVYTSSDKTEVEKILNKSLDYANDNKTLANNISKAVNSLTFNTGGWEMDENIEGDIDNLNFELTKQFNYVAQDIGHLLTWLYNITSAFVDSTK
jgi:hypothetical protein